MNNVIDLSFDIETRMPACGAPWHQTVFIEPMGRISKVGRNTSRIILGSHSGTHIDAPLHFYDEADDIRQLNINYLCGPVNVVDLSRYGKGDKVPLEAVKEYPVTERMLFKFLWYKKWKTDEYYNGFPYFSSESIDYLMANGMKVMALDTPSPDADSAILNFENNSPNHKKLLNGGVIIIEYLNNTELLCSGRKYELIALPLKLVGSDGSPSRVIVREVMK